MLRMAPLLSQCALMAAIGLSFTGAVSAALSGYARRIWHVEEGLPEDIVQSFAQTPDHFLWIGTSGGLVRFDGAQFVPFNRENTPAMRENSIFCLLAVSDGTLWIGTEGGGVLSYRDHAFRLWSAADGLTNGYIRALREDHQGRIWIGTDDGLFRWQAGTIRRMDARAGVPGISVHAIYEDRRRRLWVGGYHFFRIDGDRMLELHLPGGLTDNVKSILETRDGVLWVGTVTGLQRNEAPADSPSPIFQRIGTIHSTVRTLLEDDDGSLWIGTIGDGLFRYQNGHFDAPSANLALPSNTILSSFQGSEHNVWIGTQAGLVRLNKTAASTFALPDFADADFGTISADRDGALWVSSSHLFRLTARRAEMRRFSGPLANVRIRNVFRDRAGTLWLGTEGKGAFRTVRGELRQIPNVQPYIRAFAEDHAGGVWIGTDGGYCRWYQNATRCFEPHESVRALFVDRQGDVWVGKDRGLTRLRNGEAAESPIPRLRDEKVWAIHEDPDGTLWFGTRTGGLFRWKSGNLTAFTTAAGLDSNSIYQVLEDRRGSLWLSGPNGISSVARRDLEHAAADPFFRPAVKLYGGADGLENTQMYGGVQPAGCTTANGEVWFPSTAGAIRIGADPEGPVSAPPAIIYSVIADGRDFGAGRGIQVPPGEGKLEIQYGAIQFRSQERVRFRHQLEGFDAGWTETRARRASYTNLPAGHYTFHLTAFDIAQPGATSESSVAFDWRPHFYRAWWFYLFCVSCVAGAVWFAYRTQIRQAQARFEAVLGERNRLAREMHDTLIQGCTGVSAVLEAMASMSAEQSVSAKGLLDCARTQIRAVTDEARAAVWNLHRGGRLEISQVVDQMARQACSASQVPVRMETAGKPVVVDPLVEHDILMVAREAVYNALRHGHPHEVALRFHFRRGRVKMSVLDDGCGFEPDEALLETNGHFGLIGMRERTERLGGHFAVRSAPGQGTELSVEVPVRATAHEKRGALQA